MTRVLIFGATSAIAEACARRWANRGASLMLVSRSPERLEIMARDLLIRGASAVGTCAADLSIADEHDDLLQRCIGQAGEPDIALMAHGVLGNQGDAQRDFAIARSEIEINALSVMSLVSLLANQMEPRGHGTIVVLSSVAGDRGRASNYVYGASKAAISSFLQGVRQRLWISGVNVLTVKPGFVDTPMTRDFRKGLLWVSPDLVARDILRAVEGRRDVLYTPWFWRPIMWIIRSVPEPIFKRLSL
ncbi:MAG: SDR family oxidoreductase [Pseudomonadales bacterium]